MTILVTQVAESLDVLFDFQFQCLRDHASCPFSGQFVQRAHDLGDLSLDDIWGTLVHGVFFLRRLAVWMCDNPKDAPLCSFPPRNVSSIVRQLWSEFREHIWLPGLWTAPTMSVAC